MGDVDVSRLTLSRTRSAALYQQLTDALAEAIRRGDLPAGTRLLPERQLADRLGVSRTTIINAYRELEARGFVRGQVGRGTFVCARPDVADAPLAWRSKLAYGAHAPSDPAVAGLLRAAAQPDIISFALGSPALDGFPAEPFQALLAQVALRDPLAVFGHGPSEGQPALRQAIGARYRIAPDQVMILSGSTQGLDLLAKCFLERGDSVVVDRPGNRSALQVFGAAGVRLVGWDIARADLEELEDLFLRYRPKLLYTNPSHQNPTGVTLDLAQRRDLLELAARYRVPIVEDDAYRDLGFHEPAPPPLFHLDEHAVVILLGTFSKMLAPGLRVGWLAAPRAMVRQLAQIKLRSDMHTANLVQLALADVITSGLLDRHLVWLRGEHARRLEAMTTAIAACLPPAALRFRRPEGGLFLWCRLGFGIEAARLLEQARAAGVLFAGADLFYADGSGVNELRLCFAAQPPEAIRDGIGRLAEAFAVESRAPRIETGEFRPIV
jgi:DNA-binding transcriptional MocR family regulator